MKLFALADQSCSPPHVEHIAYAVDAKLDRITTVRISTIPNFFIISPHSSFLNLSKGHTIALRLPYGPLISSDLIFLSTGFEVNYRLIVAFLSMAIRYCSKHSTTDVKELRLSC